MNTRMLLLMATALAGSAAAADAPRDWTHAVQDALTVYKSDTGVLRKVKFSWMEQFQMAVVQPNGSNGLHLRDGASPYNFEFRRSWVGVNVDFSTGTTFHTWGRIGGLPYRESYSGGRTVKTYSYTDLFDLWVQQQIPSVKGLSVKAGKIKPLFTTDYSTPSSQIPCLERSLLSNQYGLDSNWGVDVTYAPNKQDKFYLQLFANDRASASKNMKHGDVYRDGRGLKGEFGWEDKFFAIAGASHKYGVTERGYRQVSAQYVHDFDNSYDHGTARGANYYGANVKDALSLGYEWKQDRLRVISNVVASFEMARSASGYSNNNLGWELEPIYTLCPHADLVLRYVGMTGRRACKLGADRYITRQCNVRIDEKSWVDSAHSFYVGLDLYASALNKNALKWMFGAEYTTARLGGSDCYNGWEYSSAIRWNF